MVQTDASSIIFYAIPAFFILILIEFLYGLWIGKNTYRLNDAYTSISIGIISRYPTILNFGFQSVIFVYISSKFNLELMPASSVLTWIIAFLLYDLSYYWMHRMHHEIKILWATHSVHHHGEEYNLATALRQTSTGWLWKWVFYLPMMLVGVPAEVFISVAGVNLVYQFWVHTEHIGHLGFLEKIFITPMNHSIHHAKNKEYIDANYGGVFIIWDRIFGTYIPRIDNIKPVYGTVTPLNSWNPIWANFQIFSNMLSDSIKTKNLKDKVRVWFSKTYWRPKDCYTEKNNNFDTKFDTTLTSSSKIFIFIQVIMLILVSGSLYPFISYHSYDQLLFFAFVIIAMNYLNSLFISNNSYASILILISSIGITYLIYDFEMLNVAHLSTKLLISYLVINILLSGALTSLRSLNPIRTG